MITHRNAKFFLLFILLIPCWIIGYHGRGDLPMYYHVAQLAHAGEFSKIYLPDPEVGWFFYAPSSLLLFSYMPYFSYPVVKASWVLFNTLAYILLWLSIHAVFPSLKKAKAFPFWFLIWVSSIKAIHASFQSHNVQLIIMGLLVASEWFSRSQMAVKRFIAGFLPSFMGTIKVFPIFISVYMLLTKKKETRLGVAVGLLSGLILPFVFFGREAGSLYTTFYSNLHSFHDAAPLTRDAVTLSLASLIATWGSHFWGLNEIIPWIKVIVAFIGLTFFSLLLKPARLKNNENLVWAMAMSSMVLINSSSRPDYFIFYLPAFCYLFLKWAEGKASHWSKVCVIVALLLIDFITEWTLGSSELNHHLELLRIPVIGMIILTASLYIQLLYPRKSKS